MDQLKLDRNYDNNSFITWRLGGSFLASRIDVPHEQTLHVAEDEALSYAQAQTNAFYNHLFYDGKDYLVFAKSSTGVLLTSLELWHGEGGASGGCVARVVCELSPAEAERTEVMDCSVCVLTSSAVRSPTSIIYLVSSGCGDLCLVQRSEVEVLMSPPVYPLRRQPPLVGAHSFVLGAAVEDPLVSGRLRVLVWSYQKRPSSHPPQYEVSLVILDRLQPHDGHQGGALQVVAVQSLRRCALHPYFVLGDPSNCAFLLGLSPEVEEEEVVRDNCQVMNEGGDGGDDVDPRTFSEAVAR